MGTGKTGCQSNLQRTGGKRERTGKQQMEIRKLRVGNLLLPSNVMMAPLAGYTCYPFRILAYEMGA